MRYKTAAAVLLTAMLVLSACGNNNNSSAAAQTTAQITDSSANDGSGSGSAGSGDKAVKEAIVPGRLYQLNPEDGKEPVIKGVSLSGNRSGFIPEKESDLRVNDLPVSDRDIRSIFEKNEWISVVVDSGKSEGLSLYISPHHDDPADYTDSFFAALDEDIPMVGLKKPVPEDETVYWGDIYLPADGNEAGYYDLVFTDGLKPVASVMVRMYNEDELGEKSNEELAALMKKEAEK
ncbi:MAG: hypothetical protein J6X60_13965 [Ruminiclostridium sp.]|nr:hypothetical protein [Ruminiclostridium sp.]